MREKMTISLSPRNADAVVVGAALRDIPARKRSAQLLRWAAAYLAGEQLAASQQEMALGVSDEELDQLLDDF